MIKLVSYNLHLHKAYSELEQINTELEPDVMCLQECRPQKLLDTVGNMDLLGTAQIGMVCTAMYFNPKTVTPVGEPQKFRLPKAAYEYTGLRPAYRLHAQTFEAVSDAARFTVGNVHLSHLLARNFERRRQMRRLLSCVIEHASDAYAIITGDFNYPRPDADLRNVAAEYGFDECGIGVDYRTHTTNLLPGKFDRVFISSDVVENHIEALDFGASDHAAVYAEFTLPTAS